MTLSNLDEPGMAVTSVADDLPGPDGIGPRAVTARKEMRLTQREAARLTGVCQAVVQKVESGESRRPRIIYELAAVLKVNPAWLQHGFKYADRAPVDSALVAAVEAGLAEWERSLGGRLRRYRRAAGLSQDSLAALTGTTQTMIQKIENGRSLRPRELDALARVLGVNPAYIEFGPAYALPLVGVSQLEVSNPRDPFSGRAGETPTPAQVVPLTPTQVEALEFAAMPPAQDGPGPADDRSDEGVEEDW